MSRYDWIRNEQRDEFAIFKMDNSDPPPMSLLNWLWGTTCEERMKGPGKDIELPYRDTDECAGFFEISHLAHELSAIREGRPAYVVAEGTEFEKRGAAVPGRPDIVPQEWVDWAERNIPGMLYAGAYTGVV